MNACAKCQKQSARAGVVVWSETARAWVCASAAACKKRRNQRPQYSDWANASYEALMSN